MAFKRLMQLREEGKIEFRHEDIQNQDRVWGSYILSERLLSATGSDLPQIVIAIGARDSPYICLPTGRMYSAGHLHKRYARDAAATLVLNDLQVYVPIVTPGPLFPRWNQTLHRLASALHWQSGTSREEEEESEEEEEESEE